MKILITGGHLSPALSIVDSLKSKADIVFVGRKYQSDQEKTLSLEYKELQKKAVTFYDIAAGRITRIISVRNLLQLAKIPLGFFQAYRMLRKEKPDCILSFGGYIGFPLCLTGQALKIPFFIHEQTISPGLTNKILARFAVKIFVAFEETANFFSPQKTLVSGNPVRNSALKVIGKPFVVKKTKPVIYVTGGSLGSHSLNIIIEKILTSLLKHYIVIHQTGSVKEYRDFARLSKTREELPRQFKERYLLREHFFAEELGYVYQVSDLVISRAGANTFFELLILKKPAIFIPLPWSAGKEQQKHAQLFKQAGAGEIFDQSDSPDKLLNLINQMLGRLESYRTHFTNLGKLYKKNAAETIADFIVENIQK